MKKKLLCILLLGGLLIGSLVASSIAVPQAVAALHSIPGCADYDYGCGYRHGARDGYIAYKKHQCFSLYSGTLGPTASERGYADGFQAYCPPPGSSK